MESWSWTVTAIVWKTTVLVADDVDRVLLLAGAVEVIAKL